MINASDTLSPLKKMNDPGLAGRVVLFSRFLKEHGFKVFSSGIIDSLRGLEAIDISKREDFFSVLRANLISTDLEWKLFGELFEEFWHNTLKTSEYEQMESSLDRRDQRGDPSEKILPDITFLDEIGADDVFDDDFENEFTEGATYSPVSMLERKDLGQIQQRDIQLARLILKNMISPFKIEMTRRFRRSRRPGDMDFRRIFKESLKAGGIPLELFYRKKRKRLKRLVIMTDVSGSMDRYARFVMPFIMGLKGVGSRAEVFVFSTSLTPITSILKRLSIEKALERISHEVPDWSGGTRIGYSLHQFNRGYGEGLLSKRTVVIIMSDGWDLGGRELLRREMETLSRKAYCLIWLNPLAGDPEYRPISQGMRTALPYVDYFLAADSLQSLKRVGRILSRVMAG
jgi:uncharacterized protein with von Willebrand factor type A (vWA) domain